MSEGDAPRIDPRKHVYIRVTLRGERSKLSTSKRPVPNGEVIAIPHREAVKYVERGVAELVDESPYDEEIPEETDDAAAGDQ